MATVKILVRKTRDERIAVFVPSLDAAKGYIKEWLGGAEYREISLDSYKSTLEAGDRESRDALAKFINESLHQHATIALRLPRDYQQKAGENDYILTVKDGISRIEDAHGVLLKAYTNEDQALAVFAGLKKGKSL
jgi:hypothetical protein